MERVFLVFNPSIPKEPSSLQTQRMQNVKARRPIVLGLALQPGRCDRKVVLYQPISEETGLLMQKAQCF